MASRPTIVTVARNAGVSIASVSRVVNGQPASPDMVRRVRDAAALVGYVPDSLARSLKAGQTHQLALAVSDIANPVYIAMMRAVEQVTRRAGFRLVIHSTGADPVEEVALLRDLAHRYVDGLILSPLRVTDRLLQSLHDAPAPVVVVGTLPEGAQVDSIRADSRSGVALAFEHLLTGGRRRIGFINGRVDTVPGSARREGWEAALRSARIPHDDSLVAVADDFTFQAGHAATHALLLRADPDALFCANDLLALGAVRALAERGRVVPGDVAVVGMDDTDLAAMSSPSLSSVSLGSEERGRLAAILLLERLADPLIGVRQLQVPPRLVVRESSSFGRVGTGG